MLRYLDEVLDWDQKGVEKDLMEIAHHMLGWEEQLSDSLSGIEEIILQAARIAEVEVRVYGEA